MSKIAPLPRLGRFSALNASCPPLQASQSCSRVCFSSRRFPCCWPHWLRCFGLAFTRSGTGTTLRNMKLPTPSVSVLLRPAAHRGTRTRKCDGSRSTGRRVQCAIDLTGGLSRSLSCFSCYRCVVHGGSRQQGLWKFGSAQLAATCTHTALLATLRWCHFIFCAALSHALCGSRHSRLS